MLVWWMRRCRFLLLSMKCSNRGPAKLSRILLIYWIYQVTSPPLAWSICCGIRSCHCWPVFCWVYRKKDDFNGDECGRSVAHCCLSVKNCYLSATGVIYAIMLSNLFLWNHSLRTQTNLHHCSPEETVRGERVAWVAKCCFSVNIVRSCRDIGEMQWNRVSSRPSWYRTCFGPGIIHCVHFFCGLIPIFKHFQSKAVFAHLCLEVRSCTASWCRAYLLCQTPESCFQFRIERADASHWIVCYTFFASDVNAWTRYVSLNRCEVCRSSCGGNIETLRFQLIFL